VRPAAHPVPAHQSLWVLQTLLEMPQRKDNVVDLTPSGALYTVHETFANDQELEDSTTQAGRTLRRPPTPASNTRDDLARWTRTSNCKVCRDGVWRFAEEPRRYVCDCGNLLCSFYYFTIACCNVIDHVEKACFQNIFIPEVTMGLLLIDSLCSSAIVQGFCSGCSHSGGVALLRL